MTLNPLNYLIQITAGRAQKKQLPFTCHHHLEDSFLLFSMQHVLYLHSIRLNEPSLGIQSLLYLICSLKLSDVAVPTQLMEFYQRNHMQTTFLLLSAHMWSDCEINFFFKQEAEQQQVPLFPQ